MSVTRELIESTWLEEERPVLPSFAFKAPLEVDARASEVDFLLRHARRLRLEADACEGRAEQLLSQCAARRQNGGADG